MLETIIDTAQGDQVILLDHSDYTWGIIRYRKQ